MARPACAIIGGLAAALALGGAATAQDVLGYVYDATGRLIASTQARASGAWSYTRYTFDTADNLTSRWTEPVQPLASPDRLQAGEAIVRGQRLVAGTVRLEMQHDGNVVLYCGPAFEWSANTDTGRATTLLMQPSGYLSVLGPGAVVWQEPGSPSAGSSLVLGADGSLRIIGSDGVTVVWSAGSAC